MDVFIFIFNLKNIKFLKFMPTRYFSKVLMNFTSTPTCSRVYGRIFISSKFPQKNIGNLIIFFFFFTLQVSSVSDPRLINLTCTTSGALSPTHKYLLPSTLQIKRKCIYTYILKPIARTFGSVFEMPTYNMLLEKALELIYIEQTVRDDWTRFNLH